ncbi:hypothetical protein [Nostoc piscinale]|nr:hypothetical protein [Nostoc piscinale]
MVNFSMYTRLKSQISVWQKSTALIALDIIGERQNPRFLQEVGDLKR